MSACLPLSYFCGYFWSTCCCWPGCASSEPVLSGTSVTFPCIFSSSFTEHPFCQPSTCDFSGSSLPLRLGSPFSCHSHLWQPCCALLVVPQISNLYASCSLLFHLNQMPIGLLCLSPNHKTKSKTELTPTLCCWRLEWYLVVNDLRGKRVVSAHGFSLSLSAVFIAFVPVMTRRTSW